MKYVYGIICHQITNPLIFLVNELIKSPNTVILLHVDKKSDINKIKEQLPNDNKIHYLEDRVDVCWGAYSQIECTLRLLNSAKEIDYKYFSLISGDDIPLMKVSSIEDFLSIKDMEYLGHDQSVNPLPRVKYIYPEFFYSKHKTLKKKIFTKIFGIFHRLGFLNQNLKGIPKLYKGTSWFTLSKNAVQYILDYKEKNPNYDLVFRKSYCGDEVYFHTIIYNSPFKEKLNIHVDCTPPEMALRYIDWKTGPDFPRTLDESDFSKIKEKKLIFARKIKSNINIATLEKLLKEK